MKLIFQIIISAFAVIITSYLLPGIHVSNFITACLVAIVLAVLNNLVKPLLIILTIPITFFTFGLFLLVINAFIVILAGNMVPGFRVDGFWWALAFSIILSIVSSILASVNREDNME